MSVSCGWTFRALAAALFATAASVSSAQVVVQPKANPNPNPGGAVQPKADPPKGEPKKTDPPKNPFAPQPLPNPFQTGAKPSVFVQPSINSWPGLPAYSLSQPVYQPPFWNPALQNPWMNPVTVVPVPVNPVVNPFQNPFVQNPFVMNPVNPFLNPFQNPFAVNPFFVSPLAVNPLLNNRPFNMPGLMPGYWGPALPTMPPMLYPQVSYSPPIAIKQPGTLIYKGPDLQVNPWSGTEYHPISGVVTLADGSTFYRVPGSGLPTASGTYASGSGLYYNPQGGTFFSPSTGTLSKPGSTTIFMPYVW